MLSNYILAFDYVDKTLWVSSATSGSVSIASFATIIGAPVGIGSAICGLVFSISNVIAIYIYIYIYDENKEKETL